MRDLAVRPDGGFPARAERARRGVILMLAGLLGLLLPPLVRGPAETRPDAPVRPHQPEAYDQASPGADPGVYDDHPALVQNYGVPDDRGLVEDLTDPGNHPLS